MKVQLILLYFIYSDKSLQENGLYTVKRNLVSTWLKNAHVLNNHKS